MRSTVILFPAFALLAKSHWPLSVIRFPTESTHVRETVVAKSCRFAMIEAASRSTVAGV